MGRFTFNLQPLLELRKGVEEAKQRDLDACRRSVDEACCERDRLLESRRIAAGALHAAVLESTGSPSAELRARDAHLRHLDGAIAAQHARCDRLYATYERAREELVAAHRDWRVVDALRERRRGVFEAEEARREQLELDENNARRHERVVRERLAMRPLERAAP